MGPTVQPQKQETGSSEIYYIFLHFLINKKKEEDITSQRGQ